MRACLLVVLFAANACLGARHHRSEPRPTTLIVHVIDEAGRPIVGATVRARLHSGQTSPAGPGPDLESPPATSDAAGTAILTIPGRSWPRYVVASHATWPSQAVEAEGGVATIIMGPARSIPGNVALCACPGGSVAVTIEPPLRDLRILNPPIARDLIAASAPVALDGSFTATGLGPGTYAASVDACGHFAGASFTGRDGHIALRLPDRPTDHPLAVTIHVTTPPPPPSPTCPAPAAGHAPLVAGDFDELFLDPACRLYAKAPQERWSVRTPDGAVIALGRGPAWHVAAGLGIAVFDVPSGDRTETRVQALASGATDDLGDIDARTIAPGRDDLAFRHGNVVAVRAADGAVRRIASRCDQFAWTEDRRLVYLQAASQGGPGAVRIYDAADGSDRPLGALELPSSPATVLWPAGRHVVVDDHGVLDTIDLATSTRTRLGEDIRSVAVLGPLVLYASATRAWLQDLDTGVTDEVGGVIGPWASRMQVAPSGELVISGQDVAVASHGRLRLRCEIANAVDVGGGYMLCEDAAGHSQRQRTLAVPLSGEERGIALDGNAWRLAPDRPVALAIRRDGALVAHHLDDGRELEIARRAVRFVPLDGGRVLVAVSGEGVYLRAIP